MPSHPVWRFKAKGRLTFVGAARLHRGALQPPAFSSDPVTPQPANDPASSGRRHRASITPVHSSGPQCVGVPCDGDRGMKAARCPAGAFRG